MDPYLEEDLYDLITFCIQNPNSSDFEVKRERVEVGVDATENMFYPTEFRVKEEIGKDAKPYRSWWNGIAKEWE